MEMKLLDPANNNLTMTVETLTLNLQTLMIMQLIIEEKKGEYQFARVGRGTDSIEVRLSTMPMIILVERTVTMQKKKRTFVPTKKATPAVIMAIVPTRAAVAE